MRKWPCWTIPVTVIVTCFLNHILYSLFCFSPTTNTKGEQLHVILKNRFLILLSKSFCGLCSRIHRDDHIVCDSDWLCKPYQEVKIEISFYSVLGHTWWAQHTMFIKCMYYMYYTRNISICNRFAACFELCLNDR